MLLELLASPNEKGRILGAGGGLAIISTLAYMGTSWAFTIRPLPPNVVSPPLLPDDVVIPALPPNDVVPRADDVMIDETTEMFYY